MKLFYLKGKEDSIGLDVSGMKPLIDFENPWTKIISDPEAMYCALIFEESEQSAREIAQSRSQFTEPVWEDERWSTCTEIEPELASLIDSTFDPGIARVGLVRDYLIPF